MKFAGGAWAAACVAVFSARVANALPESTLSIDATTGEIEGDKSVVYYNSTPPQLVGNDGSAVSGGFRTWELTTPGERLKELSAEATGRTKLVTVVYSIQGVDYIITLSQSDQNLRWFNLQTGEELASARKYILGDFSSLCQWRSPDSGLQYVYLFGKKEVRMYLLDGRGSAPKTVEVQSFPVPVEAEACAISSRNRAVFFGGADGRIYIFIGSDVPTPPTARSRVQLEEGIVGMAIYNGKVMRDDYLLVAEPEIIRVYGQSSNQTGTIRIDGGEDFALNDISLYQAASTRYPNGTISYAFESEEAGTRFGVSSLNQALVDLGLIANVDYSPLNDVCTSCAPKTCPSVNDCNLNGACANNTTCVCYKGFVGADCATFTCENDCSNQGSCEGPNTCQCDRPYGGPDCSFLEVEPKYETDANGGDGDDPAIWIAPNPSKSLVITTTKSDDGEGLSVFDLKGRKRQTLTAAEPNNVDILYDFPLTSRRKVDLVYAACRGDNTLCIFQMTKDGKLKEIPGGIQPTKEDFEVYGSCVYRRKSGNKFYLFVNSKTSEYLQYEVTAKNGILSTQLVRSFFAGSGGQVEGCVVDDENEAIFIGEEPYGLWRYGANPDDPTDAAARVLVDSVDRERGGKLSADVEGVTLVYGENKDDGFLIVSCQGISAYNVYRRAPPYEYVMTFTVKGNRSAIDRVTNTDGIAAVGTALIDNSYSDDDSNDGRRKRRGDFPAGLLVVHDDANETPDGGVSAGASFKLISLKDVLQKKGDDLLAQVDRDWDPRDF